MAQPLTDVPLLPLRPALVHLRESVLEQQNALIGRRARRPQSLLERRGKGWIAYHDFEGPATDIDERPRLLGDLGDKRILILRNHGLMTVGKTVGEAFVWMYRIETACRIQIDALAGGSELQPISEATQQKSIEQGRRMYGPGGFIETGKEWPALLRQLERVAGTSYRQ